MNLRTLQSYFVNCHGMNEESHYRITFIVLSAVFLGVLALIMLCAFLHIDIPGIGAAMIINVAFQPIALVVSIVEMNKTESQLRKILLGIYCALIFGFFALCIWVLTIM